MNTLYTLLIFVVILGSWIGFNYWRLRRAASIVDNATFAAKMPHSQIVDLRDPSEFRKKHILGARNIPFQQLKQSGAALRKDKPILLYANERAQLVAPAALYLKKQGYTDMFILARGLSGWTGKVKTK